MSNISRLNAYYPYKDAEGIYACLPILESSENNITAIQALYLPILSN